MQAEIVQKMFQLACQARNRTYSPYSHFGVGACLMARDGTFYTGCNIENAAYSATVCAERTALFKAVSEGVRDFVAIAIVGGTGEDVSHPCLPCGVCRQALSEFCAPDFEVYVFDNGTPVPYTLAQLLPHSFTFQGA